MALYFLTAVLVTVSNPSYTVHLPTGNITGFCAPGRACSFLGIPYGHVPRRFFPSIPANAQEVDATHYGSVCVQSNFLFPLQQTGSEACLNLNVWAPPSALEHGKLPVFVFVHGGFGYFGSSSQSFWAGDKFAVSGTLHENGSRANKIVVSINYRLGVFGMFASPSIKNMTGATGAANQLRDIILALQWVQRNILYFGGDPTRVTLAGESSGATFTCALLASPRAKGLFSHAGIQSGVCFGAGSDAILHQHESYARSQWLLDQMGVSEEALHTLPLEKIQALSDLLGTDLLRNGPTLGVDGYMLLSKPTMQQAEEGYPSGVRALFWGYTSLDEPSDPFKPIQGVEAFLRTYFGPADSQKLVQQYAKSPRWVQNLLLDGCLRCRTLQVVAVSNRAGVPSYAYDYDPFHGATLHTWDLYALFDHYPDWDPLFGYVSQILNPAKIPRKTRNLVQDAWSSFMYFGNPGNGFNRSEVNKITKGGLVHTPLHVESCHAWIAATDRVGEKVTMQMCIGAGDVLTEQISFWLVTAACLAVAFLAAMVWLCLSWIAPAGKSANVYYRL